MIDFGRVADDYAAFRPPFAPELFDRLGRLDVGLPDQLILDIGSGSGLLARGLKGRIVQCDTSLALLSRAGGDRVIGRAERLPFEDRQFDAATAAQCWHWFDRRAAPLEILRTLKPGGRLAIIYQTPLPAPGNLVEASERLILRFRPGWRHAGNVGINGQALRDIQFAGFTGIESFSFDIDLRFDAFQWHGYMRTKSSVGPSLTGSALAEFDRLHLELAHAWPGPLVAPHRVFAVVAKRPEVPIMG